jgi:hypothetical protein
MDSIQDTLKSHTILTPAVWYCTYEPESGMTYTDCPVAVVACDQSPLSAIFAASFRSNSLFRPSHSHSSRTRFGVGPDFDFFHEHGYLLGHSGTIHHRLSFVSTAPTCQIPWSCPRTRLTFLGNQPGGLWCSAPHIAQALREVREYRPDRSKLPHHQRVWSDSNDRWITPKHWQEGVMTVAGQSVTRLNAPKLVN